MRLRAEADAQMPVAGVPVEPARLHHHSALVQDRIGQILGPAASRRDVREGIDRALRCCTGHARHLVQRRDDHVPLLPVVLDHVSQRTRIPGHRGEGTILDEGVDVRDLVRRHLEHALDQRGTGHRVAQPPAIHGIGLGKGVHRDGPLRHAGQAGDADVPRIVEGDVFVDLVGDHQQIVPDGQGRETLQLVATIDPAGRVARIDDDDRLGARRHERLDQRGVEREAAGSIEGCQHHLATGKLDLADMLGIVRLQQDHLVAALDRGEKCGEGGLGEAVGHQHLIRRRIDRVEVAQLGRKRRPQRGVALQIAVVHLAGQQRIDRGALDVRRRVMNRAPELEMDQIGAARIERRRLGEHAVVLLGGLRYPACKKGPSWQSHRTILPGWVACGIRQARGIREWPIRATPISNWGTCRASAKPTTRRGGFIGIGMR